MFRVFLIFQKNPALSIYEIRCKDSATSKKLTERKFEIRSHSKPRYSILAKVVFQLFLIKSIKLLICFMSNTELKSCSVFHFPWNLAEHNKSNLIFFSAVFCWGNECRGLKLLSQALLLSVRWIIYFLNALLDSQFRFHGLFV